MAAAAAAKKKQAVQVHLKESSEVKRWCARVTLKSKEILGGGKPV